MIEIRELLLKAQVSQSQSNRLHDGKKKVNSDSNAWLKQRLDKLKER